VQISSTRANLTVASLCFAGLTVAMTQTMVVPLQAELPDLLHTSESNAAWVVTVTLLAAAVSMPVAGRLADMFGKQRVLAVDAALLIVGSVLCALMSSHYVPVLVGRGLQGVAMGIIPVGISLVREVVPPKRAAGATAAVSATMGVGAALGLPIAAWIAQQGSWSWLFWVAAALGAVVLLLAVFVIPHVHDAHPASLDVIGMIGLAAGLVAVLVGVSKANDWGWGDPRTIGSMAGGVVVLVLWGLAELFLVKDPLVDLRTTARKPVLITNVAALAIGFGMMANSIVIPRLMEMPKATGYGLGQTILEAGLWMAPGGLMMMLFAPISGRLISSVGPKITLMIGGTVLGGGYLVSFFLTDAPWQLLVGYCVGMAGVGIGYAAMPTLILDAVPGAEAAAAVGLNSLMRSVGTTVASAVMVTLLASNSVGEGAAAVPTMDGFRLCFLVGTIAAFVGVLITALLPRAAKAKAKRAKRGGDTTTAVPAVGASIESVPVAGDRPLLVAVGAGADMAGVVDRSADIAAEYGARLQVVRLRESEPMEDMAVDAETDEDARAALRAHLDRLARRGIAADGMVLHSGGDHAEAGRVLAAYADEVDARAIAFGLSARGSFFKLANVGLTAALAQESSRSVLLVPAEGAVPGRAEPLEYQARP